MAIKQSAFAKGYKTAPVPDSAGEPVVQQFEFTTGTGNQIAVSTGAAANGDKIALGVLPAGCVVLDMVLVSDDTTGSAINVGLMGGNDANGVPFAAGSTDNNRTCGTEFFAAAVDNSVVRMSQVAGFRVAAAAYDRTIGLYVTTAATTASSCKFGIIVTYGFDSQA